jgi:hypothetical protein
MAREHKRSIWLETQRDYPRFGLRAGDCLRLENEEPGEASRVAIGDDEYWRLGECYLDSGKLRVRMEGESGPTESTIELAKAPVIGVVTGFARDFARRQSRGRGPAVQCSPSRPWGTGQA